MTDAERVAVAREIQAAAIADPKLPPHLRQTFDDLPLPRQRALVQAVADRELGLKSDWDAAVGFGGKFVFDRCEAKLREEIAKRAVVSAPTKLPGK